MRVHLFVYGTLQSAAVLQAVTGKHFAACPAVLRGYARYRVARQTYPGIIEKPRCCTDGLLYLDLDAASLARLDRYEGPQYQRKRVRVRTADGDSCWAFAYVIPRRRRRVLCPEPWDATRFGARERSALLGRRMRARCTRT